MPRLIWVFAGHTLILLVLSCHGSFVCFPWAFQHCPSISSIWPLSHGVPRTNKASFPSKMLYFSEDQNVGRGFEPHFGHIFFIEIWSWNNFYGHRFPTTDSSRAVVSYWRKYEPLVPVNCFGILHWNSVDRLTDCTNMTIIGWLGHKTTNHPSNSKSLYSSLKLWYLTFAVQYTRPVKHLPREPELKQRTNLENCLYYEEHFVYIDW